MKAHLGSIQRKGLRYYLVTKKNGRQKWQALHTTSLPLARRRAAEILARRLEAMALDDQYIFGEEARRRPSRRICAAFRAAGVLAFSLSVTETDKAEPGKAEFTGADPGWTEFNSSTRAISAKGVNKSSGIEVTVTARDDGGIEAVIAGYGEAELHAEHDGRLWSAARPASAYEGYYTAGLENAARKEGSAEFTPSGAGYLTVKLSGKSAVTSRRMPPVPTRSASTPSVPTTTRRTTSSTAPAPMPTGRSC